MIRASILEGDGRHADLNDGVLVVRFETAQKACGYALVVHRAGWAVNAQWEPWMRVKVARFIQAIATRKVSWDSPRLRRLLKRRAAAPRWLRAVP